MAGHEWEDWFEREEFIGQISDIRVQNLQVEREVVQKRTFTRWMNLHLEKCNPPMEVHDLFRDIQDGRILMALLEELSGCKLLHGFKKSSHRIFRLNNIAKVLSFLEERNVKLVSIDAADVADGNSSIILGLIWNIILFFQIKELTGNIRSQFPSCSSLSSIPTSSDSDASYCSSPSDDRQPASTAMREHSKAIKKLLQWVQKRTRKYGVAVQDFGKSWTSGLAFLAVIKSIDPSLVDMRKALLRSPRENMEDAFRIAHYSLGIPRLLEPEDVTIKAPDEQCIITYVSQFLEHFPGLEDLEEPSRLTERSVSMGRLYFRDSDYYTRNCGDRRGVRERSYMFQRDCSQPPPKILISSVSEDRTALSPRLRPPAARSWSSEDFLADSPHMEDISSSRTEDPKEPDSEVLSNSATDSSQPSHTHSPTSCAVPESVTGDSAINSPDSWVDSEFGIMSEKICESTSDSSFCDSGAAWDVYRATPVEITNSDEGFVPLGEDKPPDEQSTTESCVDEGIYSLSSLENTQEQNQGCPDKKQAEAEKPVDDQNCNQYKAGEMEPNHSKTEITNEGVSTPVHTSVFQTDEEQLCATQILTDSSDSSKTSEANQSQLVPTNEPPPLKHSEELINVSLEERTDSEPGCVQDLVTHAEDGEDAEKTHNDQNESLLKNDEVENECQQTDALDNDPRDWSEILNDTKDKVVETLEKPSEAILSNRPDHERSISTETSRALANTSPSNLESATTTYVEQDMEINIPLIPIYSEPAEQITVEISDPQRQAGSEEVHQPESAGSTAVSSPPESEQLTCDSSDKNEKTLVQINLCKISENCGQNTDVEHGQLEEHGHSNGSTVDVCVSRTAVKTEISADQQECEFAHNINNTDNSVSASSDEETADTRSLHERDNTQKSSSSSVKSETVSVSRNVDLFYADHSSPTEDIAGEAIEPMDLFYPDKEEPLLPEPLDADMQSWPSVLSVSALEPAPVAVALADDQPLSLLVEDLWNEVDFLQEHDKVMSNEESGRVPGQRSGGLSDLPADGCDTSAAAQQSLASGNTAPGSRQDDGADAPVLRHRKGARFTQAMDSPTTVTAGTREADAGDSELWWTEKWELYLLLLLWLLLYSVWVLPQMDLKTLPSLLLNLNP